MRFMLPALSTQSQWRILLFSFSRFALILCGPRWASNLAQPYAFCTVVLRNIFCGQKLQLELVWNFDLKCVYLMLFIGNIT